MKILTLIGSDQFQIDVFRYYDSSNNGLFFMVSIRCEKCGDIKQFPHAYNQQAAIEKALSLWSSLNEIPFSLDCYADDQIELDPIIYLN